MVHAYHEGLPGYHEDQILHDGCEECEGRASSRSLGISYLDKHRFARAWVRAAAWQRGRLDNISHAEIPLLNALWAVQCQLENFGHTIGRLP